MRLFLELVFSLLHLLLLPQPRPFLPPPFLLLLLLLLLLNLLGTPASAHKVHTNQHTQCTP